MEAENNSTMPIFNLTTYDISQMHTIHPEFADMFEFEKVFDPQPNFKWLADNTHIPFLSVVLYLLMVWLGPKMMENRPRIELRPILIVWNSLLAFFSILVAWRTLPELSYIVQYLGFHRSVCSVTCMNPHICGYWCFIYSLSKLAELVDTLFLILRKRKVIFLHWYHHITVLLYTWYMVAEQAAPGRWFAIINSCIHAVMYTYFALRAIGFTIPRFIAMVITTLQILQMFMGVYVTLFVFIATSQGEPCDISPRSVTWSLAIYSSYLALFVRYFYLAYLGPPRKKQAKVD